MVASWVFAPALPSQAEHRLPVGAWEDATDGSGQAQMAALDSPEVGRTVRCPENRALNRQAREMVEERRDREKAAGACLQRERHLYRYGRCRTAQGAESCRALAFAEARLRTWRCWKPLAARRESRGRVWTAGGAARMLRHSYRPGRSPGHWQRL